MFYILLFVIAGRCINEWAQASGRMLTGNSGKFKEALSLNFLFSSHPISTPFY